VKKRTQDFAFFFFCMLEFPEVINVIKSSFSLGMIVEQADSSGESEEHSEMPQHAKTLIIISALIMLVGSAYLLILLATYAGVGIGLPIG